ncbi:MAG TPA: cytochrome c [Casimicrobiaceae bacterium]|nr:cytochrome c [Casimicrobiaceae bacterium]
MRRLALALLVTAVLGVGIVWWLNVRDEGDEVASGSPATPASVAQGEYLARIGNCAACHTRRGGATFAGGRGIPTPFGTIYSSNLTPDETGIGRWTSGDFWRAMHNGRSRDGRFLYPAFPYPHYTEMRREDVDALFDYLRTLAPIKESNRAHELRFPYDLQPLLAIWRALYFRPGIYRADAARPAEWNRGAYLVRGLGHCGACHSSHNPLGAATESDALGGGLIPMQGWYAPSLASRREAGVQDWDIDHIVALLRTGISPRASVLGPMAEVVFSSTQYLTNDDVRAIATFLKSLPEPQISTAKPLLQKAADPTAAQVARGLEIYESRCAECHGSNGEGRKFYPALAGNRSVVLDNVSNPIRAVLSGGYPPATAGNPRPFGMPPFAPFLSDDEVAAVVTYIRSAWGNTASAVAEWQVARMARGVARE